MYSTLKKLSNSFLLRLFPPIRFSRPFGSFELALSHCTGYDSEAILNRVLSATLAVQEGLAEYERDSVLFDDVSYSQALLVGLALALSLSPHKLCVLDYGGSLGSSYFQNRKIVSHLEFVDWRIVEQPHFVEAGRTFIPSTRLTFYSSLDELQGFSPSLLILSSVLQYLPAPLSVLGACLRFYPSVVVIDRTSYDSDPNSSGSVRVQQVGSIIYRASYPCHFLSESQIVDYVCSCGYLLVDRFPCPDDLSRFAKWKGHVFLRS